MARRGAQPDSKALLGLLGAQDFVRWGIRLKRVEGAPDWHTKVRPVKWLCMDLPVRNAEDRYGFATYRAAMRHALNKLHMRKYGRYTFKQQVDNTWTLRDDGKQLIARWFVRPSRSMLAQTIREARKADSTPSYKRADTLGWRTWSWSAKDSCLKSPHQGTLWPEPEHRTPNWSEDEAVRGSAGVHACRLPRGSWKEARSPADMPYGPVLGVLERFGKFVLGSVGWRAEWVIIKELMCADEALAEHVCRAYPEIPVSVAPKGHWLRKGV